MHACMCVCVCACVCACVRVCVCACVIIGYVRPSRISAVRPVSLSALSTGGEVGGRGRDMRGVAGTLLGGGGRGGMAPPARGTPSVVTVGMPVSGSEPPSPLELSRDNSWAALCKSIHRLHSISNSHRLLSCAFVCTSHDRRRTNDQRQGPEEQRIKDKHKVRGSHIIWTSACYRFEESTIAPKDSCGPRVCIDASGGAAILSYPRVILELSLSYPEVTAVTDSYG